MKGIMLNERVGLETATLNRMKTRTARNEFKTSAEYNGMCFFTKGKSKLRYVRFYFCDVSSYESKYAVGEIVAIKQSYKTVHEKMPNGPERFFFMVQYENTPGWTNKMFVKNEVMPHQIEITDIKLERLQDISDEDCLKEGILIGDFINTLDKYYYDIIGDCAVHKTFKTPQEAFASLIDKISGKGTWDRNEYNVVYYYKLVK
jgi:hypothetical protein